MNYSSSFSWSDSSSSFSSSPSSYSPSPPTSPLYSPLPLEKSYMPSPVQHSDLYYSPSSSPVAGDKKTELLIPPPDWHKPSNCYMCQYIDDRVDEILNWSKIPAYRTSSFLSRWKGHTLLNSDAWKDPTGGEVFYLNYILQYLNLNILYFYGRILQRLGEMKYVNQQEQDSLMKLFYSTTEQIAGKQEKGEENIDASIPAFRANLRQIELQNIGIHMRAIGLRVINATISVFARERVDSDLFLAKYLAIVTMLNFKCYGIGIRLEQMDEDEYARRISAYPLYDTDYQNAMTCLRSIKPGTGTDPEARSAAELMGEAVKKVKFLYEAEELYSAMMTLTRKTSICDV